MSWRTGATLFSEIWPLIKTRIEDREERIEFTSALIRVFVAEDMDTWPIEDIDPDIRSAIVEAGYEICEPDRYRDDGSL